MSTSIDWMKMAKYAVGALLIIAGVLLIVFVPAQTTTGEALIAMGIAIMGISLAAAKYAAWKKKKENDEKGVVEQHHAL